MNNNKIVISLLIIICILSIIISFFVFKIYKKEDVENKPNELLIMHTSYISDSTKITNTNTLIFKMDSNGKCISCRRLLTLPDKEILNKIAAEIASSTFTEENSNISLQDHTISYDTNVYNGLTENEIKDKVESNLSNYIGEDQISIYCYKF